MRPGWLFGWVALNAVLPSKPMPPLPWGLCRCAGALSWSAASGARIWEAGGGPPALPPLAPLTGKPQNEPKTLIDDWSDVPASAAGHPTSEGSTWSSSSSSISILAAPHAGIEVSALNNFHTVRIYYAKLLKHRDLVLE